MNADRAAKVIQAQIDRDLHALNDQQGIAFAEWFGERCADRLAAENLLVTDEIQAVLDALEAWFEQGKKIAASVGSIVVDTEPHDALMAAHSAYLASRSVTG